MDFDFAVSIGTHDDLAPALQASYRRVDEAAQGLEVDAFFERPGEAWCAAEHLRHLVTSVNAVARGLGMHWLTLRLLFGRSKTGSRSYEEVKEVYHGRLASGLRASGPYVPQLDLEAEDPEAARQALLERWRRATGRLDKGLTRWSPKALDRYRLPHPALGKLTLREMLLFTVYHNHHHGHRIEERIEEPRE
jgi:hypothetical protein